MRRERAGYRDSWCVRWKEYLRCGLLEFGCIRVGCERCGHEHLAAFSCKRRGFCPSCVGRRMSDTALHLMEKVFPEVAVRQWVCSLLWRLRVHLDCDRKLCADVLQAFVVEVSRSLKHRAKRALGLTSAKQVLTGAVSVIQRGDSALRLNVHFHVLVLDGVYVRQMTSGALVFQALSAPTEEALAEVAKRTALRVQKVLARHGRSLDGTSEREDPSRAGSSFLCLRCARRRPRARGFSASELANSCCASWTRSGRAGRRNRASTCTRRSWCRRETELVSSGCVATCAVRRLRKTVSRRSREAGSATS